MPRWSIPHNDPLSESLTLDTLDTYIRRYVEEDQPRPVHWARDDTRRACLFSLCCGPLLAFMGDADLEWQHLQAKKEHRKHWEDVPDSLDLDITYETVKESSPHMLKVTKTFTTAAEQERDRAMRTLIVRWTIAEHFDHEMLCELVPETHFLGMLDIVPLTAEVELEAYLSLVLHPGRWVDDDSNPPRWCYRKDTFTTEEQQI
jgi:hypothetical protein